MTSRPISDYALLSDRHSAALVSSMGSVDWLCMPRFDSPSIFAALLDDNGGHWAIQPLGEVRVERRYLAGTMVLLTTFHTAEGTLELRDALVVGESRDPHALGREAPHVLARTVSCTRGRVAVVMRWRPRPEYGLVTPLISAVDGGLLAAGGADRLVLSSSVPVDTGTDEGHARFELQAGESAYFSLEHALLGAPRPKTRASGEISALLDATAAAWRHWSDLHQNYRGRWRDLVQHSGRVLQALSYQPTGAIVAAATTSLPEQIGGARNWDYRYSWVRDASMTMAALWVAACPDEAYEFFDFMATAAAGSRTDRPQQIMFGIGGEHDLSERILPHLAGWRDSAPVRVGNGAWTQPQLDVYGELLDAAWLLRDELGELNGTTRNFLVGLADAALARWPQPDHGIWEIRGEPRHFVHSKVMCWVALDRAIALADLLGAEDRVEAWKRAAKEIRHAVETQGWNDELQTFTQSFGGTEVDATVLLLPIVGFLPPDHPRVQSSIEAVGKHLTDHRGLVRRYITSSGVDGLDGEEGTFLLCTFWLARALALAGQPDEGSQVFERAAAYVNDVALLAEEVDSLTGELLGNFPQAFSHIGLVNAAWALDQALNQAAPSEGE